jgi:hypothetical protein
LSGFCAGCCCRRCLRVSSGDISTSTCWFSRAVLCFCLLRLTWNPLHHMNHLTLRPHSSHTAPHTLQPHSSCTYNACAYDLATQQPYGAATRHTKHASITQSTHRCSASFGLVDPNPAVLANDLLYRPQVPAQGPVNPGTRD